VFVMSEQTARFGALAPAAGPFSGGTYVGDAQLGIRLL